MTGRFERVGNSNASRRGPYKKLTSETRENIIRMHSQNQSKVSIAKTLGLSESTVRGVLKRHLSFKPFNRHGGARNMKCNDEIRIHLKDLIKEDCTLTLKQLQASIIGKFGVKLALSTIFSTVLCFFSFLRSTSCKVLFLMHSNHLLYQFSMRQKKTQFYMYFI